MVEYRANMLWLVDNNYMVRSLSVHEWDSEEATFVPRAKMQQDCGEPYSLFLMSEYNVTPRQNSPLGYAHPSVL